MGSEKGRVEYVCLIGRDRGIFEWFAWSHWASKLWRSGTADRECASNGREAIAYRGVFLYWRLNGTFVLYAPDMAQMLCKFFQQTCMTPNQMGRVACLPTVSLVQCTAQLDLRAWRIAQPRFASRLSLRYLDFRTHHFVIIGHSFFCNSTVSTRHVDQSKWFGCCCRKCRNINIFPKDLVTLPTITRLCCPITSDTVYQV